MTVAPQSEVAERFAKDIADHQITVLHDSVLYRHLRCALPGRSLYSFEVVTWPGALAIRGDVGSGYVFRGTTDMFQFFRGSNGINPGYWAEKLTAGRSSPRGYDEDAFWERVIEALDEYRSEEYQLQVDQYTVDKGGPRNYAEDPGAPPPPDVVRAWVDAAAEDGYLSSEDGARRLLSQLEVAGVVSDTFEWDLTGWHWEFLWCCHAILWAIRQYDARPKENAPVIIARPADASARYRPDADVPASMTDEVLAGEDTGFGREEADKLLRIPAAYRCPAERAITNRLRVGLRFSTRAADGGSPEIEDEFISGRDYSAMRTVVVEEILAMLAANAKPAADQATTQQPEEVRSC
jgi:hypothetical protein